MRLGNAPPGLLVSVRSADEATDAMAGGADWIDIKEPAAGALGRVPDAALKAVVAAVGGSVGVSAALGELVELQPSAYPAAAAIAGIAVVKVGLAGCRQEADWQGRWAELARSLPQATRLALVHYADWQTCGAPDFEETLELSALQAGSLLLFDTFDKSRGGLLDYYSPGELQALAERARQRRLAVVVAGSLRREDLRVVCGCFPDLVAVRTAACRHEQRQGTISRAGVAALVAVLSSENDRTATICR